MHHSRTAAEIRQLIGPEADGLTDAQVLDIWAEYYRLAWAWLDLVASASTVGEFNGRRNSPAMEQR